jgi:hypothetical protein
MKKMFLIIFMPGFFFSLSAQELNLFSGFFDYQYYQDDTRIEKSEVYFLMQQNKETHFYWMRSRTYSAISNVSIGVSLISLVSLYSDLYYDTNVESLSIVGYLLGLTSSIIFSIKEHNYKKKAILKYNSTFDEPKTTSSVKINGKFDGNGLGVSLTF